MTSEAYREWNRIRHMAAFNLSPRAKRGFTLLEMLAVIVLLGIATWKSWREGSLLQAEPVALIAVAGSDQPPRPQ